MEVSEIHVCAPCIHNRQLNNWIEKYGQEGYCDFGRHRDRKRKVVLIEEFAVEVDDYFRKHYQLGEWSEYEQRGEPYTDIMAIEIGCDAAIITALNEFLPDYSHRDIARGAERFYDDQANYESIESVEQRQQAEQEEHWYEFRFKYKWEDFCHNVQYRRRFFGTKEILDDLFGAVSEYVDGTIRPIYSLGIGCKIYRARLLGADLTYDQIQADPVKALGAPPKEKTPAGRMNVEFIPAFYAAFSGYTAVAEMRPSIGDVIAVGEFVLRREIKVFDFTAFARAQKNDDKGINSHTRFDFITQLQDEISKPTSILERSLEYIPTQIAAEYLREYFECDAVIYRSSMHKNNDHDSRNIVILERSKLFVGSSDEEILSYSGYTLSRIRDIAYEIVDDIPF
jgi:hypothetical protein